MSYEEQIMSKDKCPSTFSPQMESIRPRDAFRPIARERKYLMDYNGYYYSNFIHCTNSDFLIG